MMSRERIRERVISTIREVIGDDEIAMTENTSIIQDIAEDSLTQMTLFVALEDEFQHTIPQEEVKGVDTVGDIVSYIESKLVASPT